MLGRNYIPDVVPVIIEPSVTINSPELEWHKYQQEAQTALDKSDAIAIRCLKSGIAFPTEWQTYVSELRAIIKATSGDVTTALPIQPIYPQGT